jgi:hypothetical protein
MVVPEIEAQTRHTVGDSLGWNVPPAGSVAYSTWASLQTFRVGDVLVFNFTTNIHNVAEVTQSAYNSCNSTAPISLATTGPATITLTTARTHYFICGVGPHCSLGQQLAINVTAASASPTPAPAPQPPTPATPPPASTSTPPTPTPSASPAPPPAQTPAPTPQRSPATHVVGGRLGWNVLRGGAAAYQTWASNQTFAVGDILEFNFINNTHNVAELTRAAYESCNTNTTLSLTTTSPARITLTTAGEHFFTCTFPQHCSLGQQLAINVTGSSTTAPSTPPTTPSSDTTPSGAPPPPSSSASFAVATLPITILSVALAFLY